MNTYFFHRNLDVLAQSHPEPAQKMRTFSPQNIHFDAEKNDLIVEQSAFYGQDVENTCQQQVALFLRKPAHFSLKLTEKRVNHVHQVVINQLSETARSLGYRQNTKPQQGNLILLGSGLGHQIQQLQKHLTFHNIILLEPNDEMLFHFLHHNDVAALQEQLAEKGGQFYILQAQDAAEFEIQLQQTLQFRTGFGFLAEVTVFRHYEMPLFEHILENFKIIRQKLLSSWGYFEDELAGVSHSFSNVKHHRFFTKNIKTITQSNPMLLVGNGPSLDQHLSLLKQHQNTFTVVSCGTSIAPLLKAEIVPDIHVEMERSLYTASVQQKWLNSGRLKEVFFIGLSTVSPQITSHFSHSLLFTKANDLGNTLLNACFEETFPALHFCNPTVTNFAVAAAVKLGFNNVFLLGCDYGYRDIEKHHSQSSDYFATSGQIGYLRKDTHSVSDNFGKPIRTTRIYDLARQNVEKLLSKNPHVQVTNCSDGAAIKHTQWCDFQSLCTSESAKQITDERAKQRAEQKTWLQQLGTFTHANIEAKTLSKAITDLEPSKMVLTGLRHLINHTSHPQTLLINSLTLLLNIEKHYLDDQTSVLFMGDLRYYHLLFCSHVYRLNSRELKHYLLKARVQLEKAICAYQELSINVINGENS